MRTAVVALALLVPVLAFAVQVDLGSGAPPVDVTLGGKMVAVEYCPDNTCEVFVSRRGGPAALKDFAFAYLYGVSDYSYLQEFQKQDLGAVTKELAERHAANCNRTTSRATAACLAGHIRRKYAVEVQSVRYDEGRRHVSRVRWRGNAI